MRLWDAETGFVTGVLPTAPRNQVTSVTFSPDGRRVAAGSYDGKVRIWAVPTATSGAPPPLLANDALALVDPTAPPDTFVMSVAFSRDGEQIAAAGWDGRIRRWNVSGVPTPLKSLEGHQGVVASVAHSPVADRPFSGGFDSTVRQ